MSERPNYLSFATKTPADPRVTQQIEALREWHAGLERDRASRAGLRRAQNADDVFEIHSFHRLRYWLDNQTVSFRDDTLAHVALAVAQIDTDVAEDETEAEPDADGKKRKVTFGGILARKAKVSEERLRLLANTTEIDLFLRLLRGMLAQTKREAPVAAVAELVRAWHHDQSRIHARRKLLLTYFEALETPNA